MHGTAVRRWKIVALVSVVVAISSVLLRAAPSTAQSSNATIEKLKQERVDILQTAVDDTTKGFNSGATRYTYGELCTRKRFLYGAQLEIATSHPKRMEILQSMLANAKDMEVYQQDLVKVGGASSGDLADAKVAKLDVEIAIAKEQSN